MRRELPLDILHLAAHCRNVPVTFTLYGYRGRFWVVSPADACRYFFQGAMSVWVGAPTFSGSPVERTLNEWFDVSLRENLPAIARKRGAAAYIGLLEKQVELAYARFDSGDIEGGRAAMVELLDLIHTHLHLPSKREVRELKERSWELH